MNARTGPQYLQPSVSGESLYSHYQHSDVLQLDLYGYRDEGGHHVESVALSGTTIEIAELFSGKQLENMGLWLDFKDDVRPTLREYANRVKHDAMRGPY